MSSIDVTIGQLVLSGIEPADRDALVAGLREGLLSALAEPHRYTARRTAVVRLAGLVLEPGRPGARRLGEGVGQSLGRSAR
jgi:hypothetical protein